ncbi:MAG: COX15/CtaA family protein [Hydrogenibacillus sp.]|nr:COX15/CtaA family protein [Hydrogenibacillus sp.]
MWKWLPRLVVLLTFLVLTLGVIVVATESGDACGFDWPYCNGRLYPDPFDYKQVIEYTHRLTTVLLSFVALGNAAAFGLVPYGRRTGQAPLALLVLLLLFTQAGVGGLNVLLGTPKGFTTLDVLVSEALWVAVIIFWARSAGSAEARRTNGRSVHGSARRAAGWLVVLVYAEIALGGFFKHSALAEVFFGLHPTRVWLDSPALAESVYVLHGVLGVLTLIAFGALYTFVRPLSDRRVRRGAQITAVLLLLEILAGFTVVIRGLTPFWVAAHMIMATLSLGAAAYVYGTLLEHAPHGQRSFGGLTERRDARVPTVDARQKNA